MVGLMCPKFEVYKDAAKKTRFRYLANNSKVVAVGEAYEKYASCLKGIASIKKNCDAAVEDQTVNNFMQLPNPKYEVYRDTSGEYRFRLKASNGEIIAQSEGYTSKEGCLNGIAVLKESRDAPVEDPFAEEAAPEAPLPKVVAQPALLIKIHATNDEQKIEFIQPINVQADPLVRLVLFPLMGVEVAMGLVLGVADTFGRMSELKATSTAPAISAHDERYHDKKTTALGFI
jgi:uncharacterized protein